MCGITGFVGKGAFEDLERMTRAQSYRGPDDEGYWQDRDKAVYLGHRRLSILDISGGHQPMWTRDQKLCIVFNGEIYNHIELRIELQELGYKFETDHSDTEMLLYAYRAWGAEMTSRLNGMWAFVIYDVGQRRIFGSRDRFGQKPFYYSNQNGTFGFASELSALCQHPSFPTNRKPLALKKYFAYGYIPAPHTIYENVYKLPAGYSLLYDLTSRDLKIFQYWDFKLEPFEELPKNPVEEWGEELRRLLAQGVKRRMISDVPLGVFLSGGVDSSAVSAFAAQNLGPGELNTFSIGFNEASFDESAYAARVAEHLNTNHHLDVLSIARARELLPEIVDRLDEPMGDSSLLPTYMLSKFTRSKVTVALGGDGADELFAGYDPFMALRWARMYKSLMPRPVHKALRMLSFRMPISHGNMGLTFRVQRMLRGLSQDSRLWNPVWMGTLEQSELNDLFQDKLDIEELYSEAIEYWDGCEQTGVVDRTIQYYVKLYLQDDILTKVDRASMLNSLEVRAPFLDIDLINFVRKIPSAYKLRGNTTKYVLKKALEPVLPRDILYRSKKGFGVPVGDWFQKQYLQFQNGSAALGLNGAFLKNAVEDHRNHKKDQRAFLWNTWLLEAWSLKNK